MLQTSSTYFGKLLQSFSKESKDWDKNNQKQLFRKIFTGKDLCQILVFKKVAGFSLQLY